MSKEKVNVELPESAIEFLNYCKVNKGLSIDTVNAYERDLRIFTKYIKIHKKQKNRNVKDIDIKKIQLKDLSNFVAYLIDDLANTERTIKRKVATLKSYFDYLQNFARLIVINPTYGLATPRIPKRQPIYLTLEESKSLLLSLNKNNRNYERDYCILTLFLNCGMRLSELTNITVRDIKGDILTIIGKGDKERTIYLNDACLKALNIYLEVREIYNIEDDSLFNITSNRIEVLTKNHIIKSGINEGQKYTPHKLRHTAATLMYKYGKTDIRRLQEILGHSNINNTTIYTHVDEESLREAVSNNPLNNM